VTNIGFGAFQGCKGLTSINIPNSVTRIEYEVFSGCTGLRGIDIPNSVTDIGSVAFSGCTGLTNIAIPNSVISIGGGAFRNCIGLTSITSEITEPFAVSMDTFQYWDSGKYKPLTATLYVPFGTKAKYEATKGWNQFANIVELEEQASVTLVCKDGKQAAQIFTLSGQKLSAPQKGLNIIGGKKVMMK
jgi:hypothetical protein